jgi:predicted methyltransferase
MTNQIHSPARRWLWAAVAVAVTGLINACALAPGSVPRTTLSEERIAAIVGSPDRSAADRNNDLRRKPVPLFAFMGLAPGMAVLDVSAGGGHTTELLARAVGPSGQVYSQTRPRDPNRPAPAPAAPEGNSGPPPAAAPQAAAPRPPGAAVADRAAKLAAANVAAAGIEVVLRPFEDPAPPAVANAKLDLVTFLFNYHDMGFLGIDRAQMNRAIFAALKPGGFYVIADHSGRPGTGISESGTLHRIEEAFLRREVEAAGFRLAAEGQFLRNPADPRDRNTPEPPMPKDEFVLKFVKP